MIRLTCTFFINRYTIGLGELCTVLNGVEFRTRHNDYAFRVSSIFVFLYLAFWEGNF